jgi:threonine/homoserine/homoserine lactone efflux protein
VTNPLESGTNSLFSVMVPFTTDVRGSQGFDFRWDGQYSLGVRGRRSWGEPISSGALGEFGVHMALPFMLKGLAIGFSIAAPVGPVGLLCIRRSLAEGRQVGLATGLGAATADAGYGCVAGFGLTAVSSFLVGQKLWLGLIGGLFLCYLGVRTFRSCPATAPAPVRGTGLLSAYFSTFLLTLTNPMTILSFAAVFTGFGLGTSSDYGAAGALVAGVFIGSALWWLLLSSGAALFRSQVNFTWMQAVNRVSGLIIFGFGLYSLSAAWQK